MKKMISFRISEHAHKRLRDIAARGPYQISQTSIVERGIDLAWEEMKRERPGEDTYVVNAQGDDE